MEQHHSICPSWPSHCQTSSTTFCIHGWSSGDGYTALNHRRPCFCQFRSTCLEQSSSRSAPIPDIFYFQNTPELFNISFPPVWLYHWLSFVQSRWSCLCCIHLSKFVITLHYMHCMAVWLSGNTLASINVVALRQTRLVLGWVTVCGRVNHLSM